MFSLFSLLLYCLLLYYLLRQKLHARASVSAWYHMKLTLSALSWRVMLISAKIKQNCRKKHCLHQHKYNHMKQSNENIFWKVFKSQKWFKAVVLLKYCYEPRHKLMSNAYMGLLWLFCVDYLGISKYFCFVLSVPA